MQSSIPLSEEKFRPTSFQPDKLDRKIPSRTARVQNGETRSTRELPRLLGNLENQQEHSHCNH